MSSIPTMLPGETESFTRLSPTHHAATNRFAQRAGIVISIILHAILALLFFLPQPRNIDPIQRSQAIQIIPASSLQPRKQIVSESQSRKVAEPPPDTRLLAENNAKVTKQQIKRGLADAGAVVAPPRKEAQPRPKPQAAQPQPPKPRQQPDKQLASKVNQPVQAPKPEQVNKTKPKQQTARSSAQPRLNKPLDLKARSLSKFGVFSSSSAPRKTAPARQPAANVSNVEPFSRPTGSGARFLGLSGSSDFLPDLPDGDLTLLNTKAHKYAVFVRRVAVRVFTALRASGWETLSRTDIMRIQDNSVVRVKMNAQGRIEDIFIATESGSRAFDSSLLTASKASQDPNPPKSALNPDNTLTLEFHAKTWSQATRAGPRAPLRERRWLFLGTALQ